MHVCFFQKYQKRELKAPFNVVDVHGYICYRSPRSVGIRFDRVDYANDDGVSYVTTHAVNLIDFDVGPYERERAMVGSSVVVLPLPVRFIFDAFQCVLERRNQDFASIVVGYFRLFDQRYSGD